METATATPSFPCPRAWRQTKAFSGRRVGAIQSHTLKRTQLGCRPRSSGGWIPVRVAAEGVPQTLPPPSSPLGGTPGSDSHAPGSKDFCPLHPRGVTATLSSLFPDGAGSWPLLPPGWRGSPAGSGADPCGHRWREGARTRDRTRGRTITRTCDVAAFPSKS